MKQQSAAGERPEPARIFGAVDSARTDEAAKIVERFAQAYVERGTWAGAYRQCYDCSTMKPQTVWRNAEAMSHYPGVKARVRELLQAAAERTICTAAEVLAHNFEIATANPADIVRTKRYACRHCWGFNGDYQWRNADEYAEACARELDEAARAARVPKLPSDIGGYGYSVHAPPSPDCEHCHGVGEVFVYIADTGTLTGPAAKLYKGAKQDRFGAITVELHDQAAAWDKVARILGAYKDSLSVSAKPTAPPELPADLPRERVAEAYLAMVR